MSRKATHEGYIVVPRAAPQDYRFKVLLRETAKFWVTSYGGNKFRKADGRPVHAGGRLDLTSIKELVC